MNPTPPPAPADPETIPPFDRWLPVVSPTWEWAWPHLVYVRAALDRITAGECKRAMILMPPRHGKTEMVTVRYPAWRLEQDPALRVIVGAYNQILADKFSRKIRRIANGRMALNRERTAVQDWETSAGGGLRAVGVGGGITGQGGNLIIIDDPVKSREEAESAAYRERVWEWYTDDLYTRAEPDAAILLIMTLWHEDDLGGRLKAAMRDGGEPWEIYTLPALAEPGDPLGRREGAALCPARYDEVALARIRGVMGERSFAALYQQRPRPAEGALFDRKFFRFIDERPGDVARWVRFYDLAIATKQTSDYTTGALVGQRPLRALCIADVLRGRWEWPDAREQIIQTALQDGPGVTLGIEAVAFQAAAVQELQREPRLLAHTIIPVTPDRDKYTRAMPWAERAKAGLVELVRAPWNGPFLAEVCDFPLGRHDDQVDAVSGAVGLLAQPTTARQTRYPF